MTSSIANYGKAMKEIIAELDYWMMNTGRRSNDAVKVVSYYCSALVEAGVPLWRVNIGQRFANPLLIAPQWDR